MKTKVKARFGDGEVVEMLIYGEARVGDRVRTLSGDTAVVVEVVGTVDELAVA